MKGIVFAAGIGSRLRPITDHTPKALVEINGVPMLRRAIDNLRHAGIHDIVVNIHHHPDKVTAYLKSEGLLDQGIVISDESDMLLDTGGGLLKALSIIGEDEPLVAINADILTDIPVRTLISHHLRHNSDVSLAVMTRLASRMLLFDADMRMHGWHNTHTGETKPTGIDTALLQPFGFCGIHILSPETFPLLRQYAVTSPKFSLTPFYIDNTDNLNIHGVEFSNQYMWHDIGTPERLEAARKAMRHT